MFNVVYDIVHVFYKVCYYYFIVYTMFDVERHIFVYGNCMEFDIVIIGGGWYGCHIANILKDKYKIIVLEQNDSIFKQSSYYNQNRLHIGFHYCKNYTTRNMCYNNYNRFLSNYGFCVEFIKQNVYGISLNSIIDYKTYCSIYNYEKIPFTTKHCNNKYRWRFNICR